MTGRHRPRKLMEDLHRRGMEGDAFALREWLSLRFPARWGPKANALQPNVAQAPGREPDPDAGTPPVPKDEL